MIRLALYIALAIIIALCAVWFVDNPGQMQLNWHGWEVRMSVAVFCLLVFLYTVFCWYIFRLYRWFRIDNPLKSPKRLESRRQKGLAELDLGWAALAVDDKAAAIRHGKKAHKLLPMDNGPLRLLLKAGDSKRDKYLTALQDNSATRIIALKARLEDETKQKNGQAALEILQEMRAARPDNPWIAGRIFDQFIRLGNWEEAAGELDRLVKAKAVDSPQQKHMTAVIKYNQAVEADLSGQKTAARDFARTALKNDPAFVPAALFLARDYLAQGDKSKARKVIEAIWKISPHPDLAQCFLDLDPMESPSEKFRRIRKLAGLNDASRHSLHMLAEVAMDTEHWAEAKSALNRLVTEGRESQETCHLLARLERLQKGDQAAAEEYMARKNHAAPDPAWQCSNCRTILEKYTSTCPNCQAFGRIHWQAG